MIKIQNLHKNYGSLEALKGISLNLHTGMVLGLVGPNACGKTTLMKCLLGLTQFSRGQVWVKGYDISQGTEYRRYVGYMPQNPDFPENLFVSEIFSMMEDLRGEAAPFKQELIQYFSLEDSLERPFGKLSGGTKQKVSVVLAFMFDVAVLVLDEPTVGLDPVSAAKFKDLVRKRAASNAAILIVSHVLSELEQVASDFAFVFEGKILASTSLRELKMRSENSSLDHAILEIFSGKYRVES